jgi:ABC-type uncharacterized transport system permease subunit
MGFYRFMVIYGAAEAVGVFTLKRYFGSRNFGTAIMFNYIQ